MLKGISRSLIIELDGCHFGPFFPAMYATYDLLDDNGKLRVFKENTVSKIMKIQYACIRGILATTNLEGCQLPVQFEAIYNDTFSPSQTR